MRLMALTKAALLATLALAPAAAQQPGSRQTREFIKAAGETDSFEIMEAYTALAQSSDPQIIAFAHQMIQAHGETSRQLRAAAERARFEPPSNGMSAGQSPFLAALQSLRGREFDKAYWKQQALAHRSALIVAQAYASTGDAPVIREAAASAVPIIQSHLAMAEQMLLKLEGGP